MPKLKNYVLYEYLKSKNDLKYICQSAYLLEIENKLNKWEKTKPLKNGLKDYITKDLDKVNHLYKDKYIIIQEEP